MSPMYGAALQKARRPERVISARQEQKSVVASRSLQKENGKEEQQKK